MPKHFISVLGTGDYKEVYYGNEEKPTRFVQEAVIRQMVSPMTLDDKITLFVTEDSFRKNYLSSENMKGLKQVLLENFDVTDHQIHNVIIPIGKNEEELQTIFNMMFETLSEGDQVYVDITHSFRSLPVQFLAVLSFAKVVKNISVEGIYYGAYEARVENDNRAPIFDISSFLNIIEWSHAANSFIRYGNSEELCQLSDIYRKKVFESNYPLDRKEEARLLSNFTSSLNKITRCIATTRGCDVEEMKGTNNTSIRRAYDFYAKKKKQYSDFTLERNDHNAPPLDKLIEVIDRKAERFNQPSNLEIGIQTVKWSIENHMTQQGYTALEETIKTYLCNKYGLDETFRYHRENVCKDICNCLRMHYNDRDQAFEVWKSWVSEIDYQNNKSNISWKELIDIGKRMADELSIDLINLCKDLSNGRNSINHFGFSIIREYTCDKLDNNLETYFYKFCKMIEVDSL